MQRGREGMVEATPSGGRPAERPRGPRGGPFSALFLETGDFPALAQAIAPSREALLEDYAEHRRADGADWFLSGKTLSELLHAHHAFQAAVRKQRGARRSLRPLLLEDLAYVVDGYSEARALHLSRDLEQQFSHLLGQSQKEAKKDALTGVANRRGATDYLERAMATSPSPVEILLFDIDHFKRVNDEHGHLAGDAFLVHVAEHAKKIAPQGCVGRLGGDEFIVINPAPPLEDAASKLQRNLDRSPCLLDGEPVAIGLSIGGAYAEPGASVESVIARADRAMYAAKQAGRRRHHIDRGPCPPVRKSA